jgi:hypothetical protein
MEMLSSVLLTYLQTKRLKKLNGDKKKNLGLQVV